MNDLSSTVGLMRREFRDVHAVVSRLDHQMRKLVDGRAATTGRQRRAAAPPADMIQQGWVSYIRQQLDARERHPACRGPGRDRGGTRTPGAGTALRCGRGRTRRAARAAQTGPQPRPARGVGERPTGAGRIRVQASLVAYPAYAQSGDDVTALPLCVGAYPMERLRDRNRPGFGYHLKVHTFRTLTAVLAWGLVVAAFYQKPELLTSAQRLMQRGIEAVGDAVPSPWGSRMEFVFREIGGVIWLQITMLILTLRMMLSTIAATWRLVFRATGPSSPERMSDPVALAVYVP